MTSEQRPLSTSPTTAPHSDPRLGTRGELVTATGWRVVGSEARELVARAGEGAGITPGRDEDVLYAARFVLRPRIGSGSPIPAALTVLHAAIAQTWPDAPPLTRHIPVSQRPARFAGLSWQVLEEDGTWVGELLWRHPHPVVAGAPCTTHAILVEQPGQTSLAVRVSADGGVSSVRGMVGAGQARPAFLADMHRALRLLFHRQEAAPRLLTGDDIDDFVTTVLLADAREYPLAVLAPLEDGSYVVPPAELAEDLLGLAHLYYMDRHPTTFRLTDALGDRRLSAYWGALRVYLPEFTCADRPEDHPLLVRDRLIDPVMRAQLVGQLGRDAGARVTMPPRIVERRRPAADDAPAAVSRPVTTTVASTGAHVVPPGVAPAAVMPSSGAPAGGAAPQAAPGAAARVEPSSPAASAAVVDPADTAAAVLSVIGRQLTELTRLTTRLVDATAALTGEIERLRTGNAVRTVTTTGLERRIGELEQLLRAQVLPSAPTVEMAAATEADALEAAEDAESAVTLVDVLRQAAVSHPDALQLLESAERSASESPYEDPERLAVVLDAMAQVARRRQSGALGTSLRDAFRELGIDYRGGISATTSKRLRQQYLLTAPDGRTFECEEHIVLGNSYDPRRCLRVYFTSRAPLEPRFVIGHVGRHFDVQSTT